MRKTFAPLDDALIEHVFQPVSDALFYRTSLTRAAATCFCIDTASLAWIVSRAQGLSDAVTGWDASTASLDIALLFVGLVALISLRTLFRRATTKKQVNPLRPAMQPHRAIVLLMLAARLAQMQPHVLANVADLAMLACIGAALYLGACTGRPSIRYRSQTGAIISTAETDAV